MLPSADIVSSDATLGQSTAMIDAGATGIRLVTGRDFSPTPERLERAKVFARLLASMKGPRGHAKIALDPVPESSKPCLVVVAATAQQICIPDVAFLSGEVVPQGIQTNWADRPATAWWRGDLSGPAGSLTELMRLLRVQVSVASRFSSVIDARLTGVGRFADWDVEIHDVIRGLGLLADSDAIPLPMPRYLLEIDGDPLERATTHRRLAAGCTIRVGGASKVWFDQRLRQAGGIVDVAGVGDIEPALRDLEANDRGRKVWSAGVEVLGGLTQEVAVAAFRDAVLQALEQQTIV